MIVEHHAFIEFEFGTDGDISILTAENQELTNDITSIQEFRLKELLFIATFGNASGEAIAADYMDQFHENNSVFDYYNDRLSTMVMNSTNMRNWLKEYGDDLNDELKNTEGDINGVIAPNGIIRPKLNENNSMTIFINDTQETKVYRLDSYNFNAQTGEWDCYFLVNVIDHFGLDDGDVIEFQNHIPGGSGFIAWWVLQHLRGWAPFRTDIWFVAQLSGKI